MNLDWKKKITKYPFLILAVACLVILILTRCQVDLMNPASIGILFFAIGAVSFDKPQYGIIGGLFLGITTMILSGYVNRSALISLAGLLIIVPLIVHKIIKKDQMGLIILFFILGFYLRIAYVLITDVTERQNDVGFFLDNGFNQHHGGYIQYIQRYGWIPDVDVRQMDQWYHPPFYHLCAAYFMRLYSLVLPHLKSNYEALQMFSLFCAEGSVIIMYKIIRMFDIKGKTLVYITLLLNTFPMFILSAGGINNDISMIFLFLLSLYMGMKWHQTKDNLNLFLCALFVGLGMMTKLNCWLVSIPLGIIFLYALYEKKFKDKSLWFKYIGFAAISFPLGLWFPIRNLVKYGVPITYILVPSYEVNNVPNYTVFQRLFHFIPLYDDNYSIPAYTVYTSLFDNVFYSDLPFFGILSYLLIFSFALVLIFVVVGLFCWIYKSVKNKEVKLFDVALWVFLTAELTSYIIFCFKYPFICTMNYRYISPATAVFAIALSKTFNIKGDLVKVLVKGSIILFSLLAVVFYSMLWMSEPWIH